MDTSDSKWQDKIYLYSEEYKQVLIAKLDSILTSKSSHSYQDFSSIDILHPAGHTGLMKFLDEAKLSATSHVLDVGCGLGGSSRFLASEYGFSVHGVDYLQHFVDIGNTIISACNLQDKVSAHRADILNDTLPEDTFDLATTIGILLLVSGQIPISNIANSLKKGGLLYYEDYILMQEREEMTEEDRKVAEDFSILGTRTRTTLEDQLRNAGMEIVWYEDYGYIWSEYAWQRAEGILREREENPDNKDNVFLERVRVYGGMSPSLLRSMNHYTPEELEEKYPLTFKELNARELVYEKPKIVSSARIVARKLG